MSRIMIILLFAVLAAGCAKPLKDGAPGQAGATGSQGIQGPQGPTTNYGIDELIDPCGPSPAVYDEVFLLLANGKLLWSMSDSATGLNTRLAEAEDGTWTTTDGSSCVFTISTSGNQRTISWAGGGKTWTIR